MGTFVALLRGINVGGNNKLPMAELRSALADAGLPGARTYIASGNVVLEAVETDADDLATRIEAIIAESFDLAIDTIVLDVDSLAAVVAANPFPDEPDHRRLHAIFQRAEPDAMARTRIAELVASVRAKGSRDDIAIVGRTVYLHTPDGFGDSDLAKALTTRGRNAPVSGTARNWATVTTVLGMCRQ
jgi:uncharacterized protein (DUF1697 family)